MKNENMRLAFLILVACLFCRNGMAQTNTPYAYATCLGDGKTMVTIAPPTITPNIVYYLLNTNQIVTINSFVTNYIESGAFALNFPAGGGILYLGVPSNGQLQFTGATSIQVNYTGTFPAVLTFTVYTPQTNLPSYIPANTVVIPSDSGGNVQIVLESSSDLINWFPSLPGTYGNTYTNRFFRVRAVAQ
jgi:hypothetical protein